MKILFVIRSLANAHGVERTIIDKANYLAENHHDVLLVTYEQGSHPYAFPISPSVKCVDLDCRYFTVFKYSLPRRLCEAWRIRRRFYERMRKLMKTCFFIVSTILRNEKIISPSFSNQELRDFMIYPISLSKVCSFRQMRLQHLYFYLLGLMPPSLSLLFMKLLAKRKGLI